MNAIKKQKQIKAKIEKLTMQMVKQFKHYDRQLEMRTASYCLLDWIDDKLRCGCKDIPLDD